MNSVAGDDLACTDEIKVYEDEGEEDEQVKSSENLTEDKVGLVIESEEQYTGHTSCGGATRYTMHTRCECQHLVPMCSHHCLRFPFFHIYSLWPPYWRSLLTMVVMVSTVLPPTTVTAVVAADAVNSTGEEMRSSHSIINMTLKGRQRGVYHTDYIGVYVSVAVAFLSQWLPCLSPLPSLASSQFWRQCFDWIPLSRRPPMLYVGPSYSPFFTPAPPLLGASTSAIVIDRQGG
ncbi:unnamed protein product [Taenia asiatica]|uniref:CTNNB1_binding domain-containing protein n=1 Tax=Taenia asiatica TaxID=60517 RepID=A0A0R3VU78_TAEAS|nr:unnamed protein product [Taenia asiatica]